MCLAFLWWASVSYLTQIVSFNWWHAIIARPSSVTCCHLLEGTDGADFCELFVCLSWCHRVSSDAWLRSHCSRAAGFFLCFSRIRIICNYNQPWSLSCRAERWHVVSFSLIALICSWRPNVQLYTCVVPGKINFNKVRQQDVGSSSGAAFRDTARGVVFFLGGGGPSDACDVPPLV